MVDRYKPSPVGELRNVREIAQYVQQEFQRLSNTISGLQPQELEPLAKEPDKKRDRLVVFADGINWDPGAGPGMYMWLGGQWNHIPMTPLTAPPPPPPPPPDEEPPPPPGPLPPQQGRAVMTFHSAGLYWTPPSTPSTPLAAIVEYRKQGESAWKVGPPMWYDARNNECRGSVFWLDPNTTYEFQFSLSLGTPIGSVVAKTWNETFPEGEVVALSGTRTTPLVITSGGTAQAYKVYQPAVGQSATIDVQNSHAHCIEVRAPYVIIRGLTIRNAQMQAIRMFAGASDVVIERNDISNWGRRDPNRSAAAGWDVAVNGDSAIFAYQVTNMNRMVVQYNHIHDPRYGTSPWDTGHPRGPNGVDWNNSGQNHVIRWNTIDSSNKDPATNWFKFYMDGIGGNENFSDHGFPGADSDIYGNYIYGCMDDGIEAEGGGQNVRVWGNHLDMCATGVASTVINIGPLYIMRNVLNRSRFYWITRTWDTDTRAYFGKAATLSNAGGGLRFVFHNTTMQHPALPGFTQTMGIGSGMSGLGDTQPLTHTYSRNNIFHIWKDHWGSYQTYGGTTQNDFDYDLYNGTMPSGQNANGIRQAPVFKSGHGPLALETGKYQLEPGQPGHDSGQVINNINSESYLGTAPDRGAHEEGTPDLKYGHLNSGKGAGAPVA